jgi:hypothetical protein
VTKNRLAIHTPSKLTSQRKLDAYPDRFDIRDWGYQPTLTALPDALVNCSRVSVILDQGREGACTGFALSAVINYLLGQRGLKRMVSPRMLFEMARCYDEWPGEKYDGSSARGAIKGWTRHGVCERSLWTDDMAGRGHLDAKIGKAALENPAGAYYRIKPQIVRDVHAALAEVGIVYCTIMVHDGWSEPGPTTVPVNMGKNNRSLPVISRIGRAESGHAIALVGYTRDGFIVQNSWGTAWGRGGFALLPYEDFLLHATDAWVTQLGVPLSVDLWAPQQAADTTSGRYRASREIPLAEVRPFIIDVGNNGELSQTGDYWTSERDLERLFQEAIPDEAKKRGWNKKRVMLYLHGGLNSEDAAATRVVAFRDKCLANEIYPLHIMWETGALETIGDTISDLFTNADERSGRSWLEGMDKAKDFALELTVSSIGTRLWSEMKENAWRASDHRLGKGAIQLMKKYALDSLALVSEAERQNWELHVVAHSAGSILFAHAVEALSSLGVLFKTVQFFAPAVRIDEFETTVLPSIKSGRCPKVTMYVLSKKQELDDTVGPYGKSLLWLVSNAFEDERGTPILGVQQYIQSEKRKKLRKAAFNEIIESVGEGVKNARCSSETHGGFDNDPATINEVLSRILGKKPKYPFNERDLDY